jgi:trans-aconitate methyltransferase
MAHEWDAERPIFLDRCTALLAAKHPGLLAAKHPAQADGKILRPYPRLFFIATKPQ